MKKELKYLEIVLENCDVITVPSDSVKEYEKSERGIRLRISVKPEFFWMYQFYKNDIEKGGEEGNHFLEYVYKTEVYNVVYIEEHYSDGSVIKTNAPYDDGDGADEFWENNKLEKTTHFVPDEILFEIYEDGEKNG